MTVKLTQQYLHETISLSGRAINANNGRCALIEDALIRAGAVSLGAESLLAENAALAIALAGLLDALDARDYTDPEHCGISQQQWDKRVKDARDVLDKIG